MWLRVNLFHVHNNIVPSTVIFLCNLLGITFPVEFAILSVGTVFPLSFAINQSFMRRESAAGFVTQLRVFCMALYLLYSDYRAPDDSLASRQLYFGHEVRDEMEPAFMVSASCFCIQLTQ
jgi:hypothetical protein